jgi:hypothetical protein
MVLDNVSRNIWTVRTFWMHPLARGIVPMTPGCQIDWPAETQSNRSRGAVSRLDAAAED